jgi:tetratricopeptide (TPR) repeat protein
MKRGRPWEQRGGATRRAGVALAAALALGGCVRSEGAQVKTRVDTIQKEQTPEKLFERGRAFAAVGDSTRAEQYLAAALDSGGDDRKILPILMAVCVEGKRYRVAIDYGEAHLRRHPDDQRLRLLLGTLYFELGEDRKAKACFEEVLSKKPDDAEANYALGVLYRDKDHDLVRADRYFRNYVRLRPDGDHAQDARASLLKTVP